MDSGQLPPRPWGEGPSAPAPPATAAALSPGRALAGERVRGLLGQAPARSLSRPQVWRGSAATP